MSALSSLLPPSTSAPTVHPDVTDTQGVRTEWGHTRARAHRAWKVTVSRPSSPRNRAPQWALWMVPVARMSVPLLSPSKVSGGVFVEGILISRPLSQTSTFRKPWEGNQWLVCSMKKGMKCWKRFVYFAVLENKNRERRSISCIPLSRRYCK